VIRALRTVQEIDDVEEFEDNIFDLTVNRSPKVRATLTRVLERTGREASLHYLRLFLADPDPRVVANAVEVLGGMGDPRVDGWIQEMGEHPYPRVRVNALLALGLRGDAGAISRLERCGISGESDELRTSASWALATLEESGE
jgi:HEAT repeat protein